MKYLKELNLQMVKDARLKIDKYINNTPFIKSIYLSDKDTNVFFKLETTQEVKSFKIRGALNKMFSLTEDEKNFGVATISSGNHGASVALGAQILGIKKAVIIVPANTTTAKLNKIKYFGAEVLQMGNNYDEAHNLGTKYIEDNNLTLIDSYYDDPYIYAGQGTMVLEILEKNPNIDTIIAPIGGGGLIGGICVAAKETNPNIKVYGVQTEACPAMKKSLEDDFCYEEFESEDSICESLIGGVGPLAFEICKKYLDDIFLVSEKEIRKATAFMGLRELMIVEPSSATVVAAFEKYKNKLQGKNIALVLSGANPNAELILNIYNEYKSEYIK
ncbi:threonine dehydratase [Anaerosphaera aminiphila DSM 21120]|uniref:threonine ammonia-lyase n=1 Tax=Anaerosphaera aminiphila DSM 21120 TaxID=1120995 RepID=A0A1M5PCN1_9FIRM|nr:threonine/serine dehydratase [Anaerosphaera aminiphila]SHG99554.1 threonine dehydratase [Anaerosphaera aminiphila DSM 21120]